MVVATENVWTDMISEVDQNNDGLISQKEFEEYMLKVLRLNYVGSGRKIKVPSTPDKSDVFSHL